MGNGYQVVSHSPSIFSPIGLSVEGEIPFYSYIL